MEQLSLTVALPPGKYTIYDPVGQNRQKGFVARVIVGDGYYKNRGEGIRTQSSTTGC